MSAVAALRETAKGVMVDGTILDLIERAREATLGEQIEKINGNFTKTNHVSIVYSTDPKVDARIGKVFSVAGIFTTSSGAERYMAFERMDQPKVHFRCLSFFEGRFSSFIEYPAVE